MNAITEEELSVRLDKINITFQNEINNINILLNNIIKEKDNQISQLHLQQIKINNINILLNNIIKEKDNQITQLHLQQIKNNDTNDDTNDDSNDDSNDNTNNNTNNNTYDDTVEESTEIINKITNMHNNIIALLIGFGIMIVCACVKLLLKEYRCVNFFS